MIRELVETFHAFRAGAPLGDVAVMKVAAIAGARGRLLDERLAAIRGYAPPHDLARLRGLPHGTLGREYARFLDANGIVPLEISPPVLERYTARPYVVRYTLTHDLHHVLTGFDAGIAGEVGVAAFTAAQGIGPVGPRALSGLRWVYAALAPSQAVRIFHNARVGAALGKRARLLIAEPLEAWFEEPIDEVRARLDVPDPAGSGILASGESLFARVVYRRGPAPRVARSPS